MFTARYGLSPYIKQIRLVFKRLRKKLAKCCILRIELCGVENLTLWKLD